MLTRHLRLRLTPSVSALMLLGCGTIHVDVPPSAIQPPAQFESSAPLKTESLSPGILARWWGSFGDVPLNELVDAGLQYNRDIRTATARLRAARATVTIAESALYPTVDAVGMTARSRAVNQQIPTVYPTSLSPAGYIPIAPIPGSSFSAAGLSVAWEADIIGGRRSDTEAASQISAATEEDLHGVQVLVTSDIAINYFEVRGLERRLEVLERSIAAAKRLNDYARGRFAAGQATRAELESANSEVQSLESKHEPLMLLLKSRLRRLAVLTGQTPESLEALPRPMLEFTLIEPSLPKALPSEVLERRPDVRGAAHLVLAQAAKLGSAKADLLPRFYFGFTAQDGHLRVSGMPNSSGVVGAFGAGMTLPILNAGRIRANITAQEAHLAAAAVQYEQAVLTALEDVENAYNACHALQVRADKLGHAVKSAEASSKHMKQLFENGAGLLRPALESTLRTLEKEDELIQAQTARTVAKILLFKAIGGGWSG